MKTPWHSPAAVKQPPVLGERVPNSTLYYARCLLCRELIWVSSTWGAICEDCAKDEQINIGCHCRNANTLALCQKTYPSFDLDSGHGWDNLVRLYEDIGSNIQEEITNELG